MFTLAGPFDSPDEALSAATETDDLLGAFVLPPVDGPPSRAFQTLHIDFALPVRPVGPRDLAYRTALHVPAGGESSGAATRFVPLASVLPRVGADGVARLAEYGRTHGAFTDDAEGYAEGSLARLVDALEQVPALPSVKVESDFLCGTEFASLREEVAFFAARGIDLEAITVEVVLEPGQMLVFDNLAVAHGRRGVRRPGELRQWVFGTRNASVAEQLAARDLVLAP